VASLPAFPNIEKRNFRRLYFVILAIFGSCLAGAGNCRAADETLQPGVVLPKVATRQQAEQSYALYLPSTYSAGKSWPIVYAFDPAARGRVPVDLMKDAAEKYGYIIAASNNSRNGLWKMESEAATAVFNDTHARLSIDDKRVYFGGFSGAARVSATLAQRCKCSAGVILAGAGFTPDAKEAQNPFPVFSAIGTLDFDYGEMVTLDEALEKSKTAHFLRRFEGPHEWPAAAVFEEALAWLRLLAMKTGREARDDGFIAARLALEAKQIEAFATSDPFATWFEARQAAETFEGLADVSQFRAREKSLESARAVTDAAKHEKQEIKEQQELAADIYSALGALGTRDFDNNSAPAAARNDLRQQILTLKSRADREKRPDKSRVLKRALTGVFVTAMESGRGRMDVNDPRGAEGYFELATGADPDSVWALTSLAVARASDGDKKAALETLRHLKEKWSDRQAFKDWLNGQAAFSKMRDAEEFRALRQ
jgi:predicted esterase